VRSGAAGKLGLLVGIVALGASALEADTRHDAPYDWLVPYVLTARGDPHFGSEPNRYALTYGLALSAAVAAGDESSAQAAEDWLMADMLPGGWGMAWTWDPFDDGSPTPAGTPFAITTAIAIDGLLDRGVDAGTADRIGDVLVGWARDAWTDGSYWYSLAAHDAIDTPNVNAMLAGATARFLAGPGSSSLSPDERRLLEDRVAASLGHLAATRTGEVAWLYSAKQHEPNDLNHHVYILWGAERARAAGFDVAWTRDEALASIEQYDVVYPSGTDLTPAMAARTDTEVQIAGTGSALIFAVTWGGDVDRWSREAWRSIRVGPIVPRLAAHSLLGFALAGMTVRDQKLPPP
jgi:hypothetical protein